MITFENSVILVLSGIENYEFYKVNFGEEILYKFSKTKNIKEYIFGIKVFKIFVKENSFTIVLKNLEIDKVEFNLIENNIEYEMKKTDYGKIIHLNDLEGHTIELLGKEKI